MICTHIIFLHLFLLHRSPLISWMVYLLVMFLTIHVIVVILRNHRAVCVQLHLALVSCSEHLKEKKITYVQIHEAKSNLHKWDCSFEHSRMYSYFWMWRMSTNAAKWSFLIFYFRVPSLWSLFIPYFSVSRQISRIFWTIRNSRFPQFAEQNHIRSPHFFLPRFSRESISYSPDFTRFTWRIFVSQIRCAARRDNVCLLSPSKGIKSFLEIFSLERIRAQRCNKVQSSVLPCNINTIAFIFTSNVLAFLPSSHRIVYFFSEEFRSKISLGNKEWFFSRHASWTLVSKWWQ